MKHVTLTAIAYRAKLHKLGEERFAQWLRGKQVTIVGECFIDREGPTWNRFMRHGR
jgi:phage antirepressor YoqD-like protein